MNIKYLIILIQALGSVKTSLISTREKREGGVQEQKEGGGTRR